MARWMRRAGMLLALVLVLAGCSAPGTAPLTPEQKEERDYFFTANMLENLGKQKALPATYLRGLNEVRIRTAGKPDFAALAPFAKEVGLEMADVRKYVERYRQIEEAGHKAQPPMKKEWFSRLTIDAAYYKPLDQYARDVGL